MAAEKVTAGPWLTQPDRRFVTLLYGKGSAGRIATFDRDKEAEAAFALQACNACFSINETRPELVPPLIGKSFDLVQDPKWDKIDEAIENYSQGKISDLVALGIIANAVMPLLAKREFILSRLSAQEDGK